jgi:hypothetical protein
VVNDNRPFGNIDLDRTIALRWTMRDIVAKRLMILPINHDHLNALIGLGLVEMRDDEPVLTNVGHDALIIP